MTTATVATLTVWRVRRRDVPGAFAQIAAFGRQRAPEGRVFAKLVGTAGPRFTPRDAQPTRWAMLAGWTDADVATGSTHVAWFARHAVDTGMLLMRPVWSRGQWDGRHPFGDGEVGDDRGGPVVALTRSTVRLRTAARFYRAVPQIARDLRSAAGLRLTFGIGERPVLRQGTVSVWDDVETMNDFARRTSAHVAAVRATPRIGWYAEEMFTRFALLDSTGTFDGRPLALRQATA